jgi:hypothetical protein
MGHVKIADRLGRLGAGDAIEDSVCYLNDGDPVTQTGTDRGDLQSNIASTNHEDAVRINQRLAKQHGIIDRPKSEQARQTLCSVLWESPRPRTRRHHQLGVTNRFTAGKLDHLPSPIDAHDALSRANQYAKCFKELLRTKYETIHRRLSLQKCLGERRTLVRQPRLLADDRDCFLMPCLAQTGGARKCGLTSSYNDDIIPHEILSTPVREARAFHAPYALHADRYESGEELSA